MSIISRVFGSIKAVEKSAIGVYADLVAKVAIDKATDEDAAELQRVIRELHLTQAEVENDVAAYRAYLPAKAYADAWPQRQAAQQQKRAELQKAEAAFNEAKRAYEAALDAWKNAPAHDGAQELRNAIAKAPRVFEGEQWLYRREQDAMRQKAEQERKANDYRLHEGPTVEVDATEQR